MTVTLDTLQVVTVLGIVGLTIIWITEKRLNRKIIQCEKYLYALCVIAYPTTSKLTAEKLCAKL